MIKSIGLNNFKCFEETHLDFRLVNVFIGPNGSGKSSIAQALMILKQSVGKKYLNLEEPINLGKFEDILYSKAKTDEITISLSGKLFLQLEEKTLKVDESVHPFVNFSYKGNFNRMGLKQQASFEARNLNIFSYFPLPSLRIGAQCEFYEEFLFPGKKIDLDDIGSISLKCGETVGQPIEINGGSINKEKEYRKCENTLRQILGSIKFQLNNTYYVSGLRGISTPIYGFCDEEVKELIQNKAISADAEKLVTALGEYPDIAKKTSRILESVINTNIQYKIAPGRKQTIDVLRHDWKTSIVNEGLGLNQMLFPLFQVLIAPEDSFIIIEEPELHLHPRAQAKFVNELVKIAKEEKKQLLLITHSEHILFRLLTLIAKKELSSRELNIYSFSLNSTGARAKKLEVTEDGRLKGALPGFFEHEIEELGEFLKAASESQ